MSCLYFRGTTYQNLLFGIPPNHVWTNRWKWSHAKLTVVRENKLRALQMTQPSNKPRRSSRWRRYSSWDLILLQLNSSEDITLKPKAFLWKWGARKYSLQMKWELFWQMKTTRSDSPSKTCSSSQRWRSRNLYYYNVYSWPLKSWTLPP